MDYAIIVAGGRGLRMGTDVPKQFLPVGGKPILMLTLERFHQWDEALRLILVLPADQHAYWQALCEEHHFGVPCELANGGKTRFESVSNGLRLIPDDADGLVAVHDGVRPFPSNDTLSRCFGEARLSGAAIPVVPVVETLRSVKENRNVLRSDYRLVQTPQTFSIALLKRAYRQDYSSAFTDDASVVEAMGMTVAMTEGNRENIKITTPFDLTIAEALIAKEHQA